MNSKLLNIYCFLFCFALRGTHKWFQIKYNNNKNYCRRKYRQCCSNCSYLAGLAISEMHICIRKDTCTQHTLTHTLNKTVWEPLPQKVCSVSQSLWKWRVRPTHSKLSQPRRNACKTMRKMTLAQGNWKPLL